MVRGRRRQSRLKKQPLFFRGRLRQIGPAPTIIKSGKAGQGRLNAATTPGRSRFASKVVFMKVPEPVVRLPYRRGSVEFCLGSEADHEAVFQTLLHVYPGADREAFLGALGDPAYVPEQRLLAKVDGRVVSHAHLTERAIRYGSHASLAMNGVLFVGTLPEYRGLGFAQNLIRLADGRARETGVAVQALTTGMPRFYRPLGYGVCAVGKRSRRR